jgi:hypothetical protein
LLGNSRKTTYIVLHGICRSFVITAKTMHGLCQHRPSSAAQCRTRADMDLSAFAVAAGRLQLPASADMLGVWRRSDRTFRFVGRRLDDAGAAVALPSLGHVRHRQRAAYGAPGCAMVSAVALRTVARRQRPMMRHQPSSLAPEEESIAPWPRSDIRRRSRPSRTRRWRRRLYG